MYRFQSSQAVNWPQSATGKMTTLKMDHFEYGLSSQLPSRIIVLSKRV